MKRILLIISLCLIAINSFSQDFDDAKGRYERDSLFSIKVDENIHDYCEIVTVNSFGNHYTRMVGAYWNDYGTQPYEILSQRDSLVYGIEAINGLDTGVIHLDALIGATKSGACFFAIIGSAGNRNESVSINNINSNAYDASTIYGWKFRYWYFADRFGLTIK